MLENIIYQKYNKKLNVIINGKQFYDQPVDSDIKRYREIRKLTTRRDKDYTTGSLLDSYYMKIYYRLIAVDLSRQKEKYLLYLFPMKTQKILLKL